MPLLGSHLGEVLDVCAVNVGEVDEVEVGGLPGLGKGRPGPADILRVLRRDHTLLSSLLYIIRHEYRSMDKLSIGAKP